MTVRLWVPTNEPRSRTWFLADLFVVIVMLTLACVLVCGLFCRYGSGVLQLHAGLLSLIPGAFSCRRADRRQATGTWIHYACTAPTRFVVGYSAAEYVASFRPIPCTKRDFVFVLIYPPCTSMRARVCVQGVTGFRLSANEMGKPFGRKRQEANWLETPGIYIHISSASIHKSFIVLSRSHRSSEHLRIMTGICPPTSLKYPESLDPDIYIILYYISLI